MVYCLFGARVILDLLLIGPLGTNLNEIWIEIQNFHENAFEYVVCERAARGIWVNSEQFTSCTRVVPYKLGQYHGGSSNAETNINKYRLKRTEKK